MFDDDGKLRRRYSNKRVNAEAEGIGFHLTYEEFVGLLREAGIVSSDLGIDKYHLARYRDQGDYTVGNCRFIWYTENVAEKKVTEEVRASSRRNQQRFVSRLNSDLVFHEKWVAAVNEGTAIHRKQRKVRAKKRRAEFERNANQSYLNEKNSQHGTCWIVNHKEMKNQKNKS